MKEILQSINDNVENIAKAIIKLPKHAKNGFYSLKRKMITYCKQKRQSPLKQLNDNSLQAEDIPRELIDLTTLRHNEADLICPICLNFIAKSVNLRCGHSYCEICIYEYRLFTSLCLVCEKPFKCGRHLAYCKNLDRFIEAMLLCLDLPEELESLRVRKQNNLHYQREKIPVGLEVGKKIDILSPERVWTIGIIRRVSLHADTRIKQILIHYEGLPNIFDEELTETSSRLAKYGFYTSRNGIYFLTN